MRNYLNKILSLAVLTLLIILIGCSNADESTEEQGETEDEKLASELNVALESQPVSLDPLMSPAGSTVVTSRNIFETVVTLNESYEVVARLAESFDISDDGKEIVFHLREGIKFHNGDEMTADDVVASMDRWKELSSRAETLLPDAEFTETDEYTVTMTLDQAASDVMPILAGQGQFPAIMPKEVVESADSTGVTEFIGTGPYVFEEFQTDNYLHLKKYDDYQALDEPASGLAGKKEVFVEDLYFHFVSDAATAQTGLQTDLYDIVNSLALENYETLKEDETITLELLLDGKIDLYYNKKEGPFADKLVRQAVNAAIDAEEVMQGLYPRDRKS